MDCSPPGSSVHGISQERTLEWVAIYFSRGSSWPTDRTLISCIGRRVLCHWATREVLMYREDIKILVKVSVQFSSVGQSCPTLCDPMNRSTPGLPVHHQLPEFTQTHVHWVGYVIQPSHPVISSCRPLFLLPPIPPSIRVFSNESILCMRWPKYWSFGFSISPSNDYPGLISFRMG